MKDISSGSFSSLFLLTRQNSLCTVHQSDNQEKKPEVGFRLLLLTKKFKKKIHVVFLGPDPDTPST
jgi:hypothetical protein